MIMRVFFFINNDDRIKNDMARINKRNVWLIWLYCENGSVAIPYIGSRATWLLFLSILVPHTHIYWYETTPYMPHTGSSQI